MTKGKSKKRIKLNELPVYNRMLDYSKGHKFPGSEGKSIYLVMSLLLEGLKNSVLAMRASALAFKFMMAAIPALILINTALPLLLPEESKDILLSIFGTFLPRQIFSSIAKPVSEAAGGFAGSVISITAITTLYFAVNGIRASIVIFNNSYHTPENRPLHKQFGVALLLVFILLLLTIVAVPIFFLNQEVIEWLRFNNILGPFWSASLVFVVKYTFFFLFITFILAAIYHLAPAKKKRLHLFSPGTIMAAFLTVMASIGFDAFISGFTRYEEVYGGISALFILMLFLFILSMIFLIGFEINAALYYGVSIEKENPNSKQN
ncbi:MAG: YihY/virulence factor BrkB family protein [Bacteroidales bacterium]